MIKYYSTATVFEEIPDYVTLAIEITNCPGKCEGCHSPWLREDIGEELTPQKLDEIIRVNRGVNCICFMGEGNDPEALKKLALLIACRSDYPYKVALYSGRPEVEREYEDFFDFIKVGPYIEKYGPLNKETTNQRLYEIEREISDDGSEVKTNWKDITYKFWKKD